MQHITACPSPTATLPRLWAEEWVIATGSASEEGIETSISTSERERERKRERKRERESEEREREERQSGERESGERGESEREEREKIKKIRKIKKKEEKEKKKKKEEREEKKKFAVFLHCTAVLNCVRATHGLAADRAPVYRGCPCRDPLGCPLIPRQNGIRDKAPTLWLLLCCCNCCNCCMCARAINIGHDATN